MAQFTISWDNTDVAASSNATAQRVSYRRKTPVGAWSTGGFTPSNDMAKSVNSAASPILTSNVIWQFKTETICTQNGPVGNDNGVQDQIGFACIDPNIVNTNKTSAIEVNLTDTDITKVRFTLRKSVDNSVVFGPLLTNRLGNKANAVAPSLTDATDYYWQIALYATVNGVEVNSAMPEYLNGVCGPYPIKTDGAPAQLLAWVADQKVCQKSGGFATLKSITGLSSPSKVWHDATANLVYVADFDNPNGNIYWFNPDTATNASHMNYSNKIAGIYKNVFIDAQYKRIYLIGDSSNGLLSYDIATDTITQVTFGTNGAFNRTLLFVEGDKIYVNDGTSAIVILNRNDLTILSVKLVSTIPAPTTFNLGSTLIARANNGNLFVVPSASFNAVVRVYSGDLNTLVAEIMLPGIATWAFGSYWMNVFYDKISDKIYIGDIGSSQFFVINPDTGAILYTYKIPNKEGKVNAAVNWSVNPITNEIYMVYQGLNGSADGAPIRRTYVVDRTTYNLTFLFEDRLYYGFSRIEGTDKVVTSETGQFQWNGNPSFSTDGIINILSQSATTENTGIQIVTTLKQVDLNNTSQPTGQTKVNTLGDADYIPPTTNLTDCPVTYSTACPTDLATTFGSGKLEYEFNLENRVKNNPNIAKIQVFAFNANTNSIEGLPTEFVSPYAANLFKGEFTGLSGANYNIKIKYLSSTNTELQTC